MDLRGGSGAQDTTSQMVITLPIAIWISGVNQTLKTTFSLTMVVATTTPDLTIANLSVAISVFTSMYATVSQQDQLFGRQEGRLCITVPSDGLSINRLHSANLVVALVRSKPEVAGVLAGAIGTWSLIILPAHEKLRSILRCLGIFQAQSSLFVTTRSVDHSAMDHMSPNTTFLSFLRLEGMRSRLCAETVFQSALRNLFSLSQSYEIKLSLCLRI